MKFKLVTCLLLIPLFGEAQYSFKPNSDSSIFDTPHDTTALFQYKCLEASAWHFSSYLELTYNQDSTWKYRRIVISNIDDQEIELAPIDSTLNIEKLWQELVDIGFLTLKPEDEESYRITVDGKFIELPYEKYQMMWPTDMSNYVSEFSSQLGIRTIMHYAPITMMNKLNQSEQTWYVPELYKAAFCYELIRSKFQFVDYRDAFYECFKPVEQENTKRKKKKRR